MLSRIFVVPAGIIALAFVSHAFAKPAEIITSVISCNVGTDTKIIIRDTSEPNYYSDGTVFEFQPFIAQADMFKRINSLDGQLRDVQIPLKVNLGNLNVVKSYIADFNIGLATIVHAGMTPGVSGQSDPGHRDVKFLYTYVPAVAGTPLQTDRKVYETSGLRESKFTKKEQTLLASPFDIEFTNNPYHQETLVMTFPGSPAGATAKALIAHSYYNDDASDLIYNGHFDVHGKLPTERDLYDCKLTQTREGVI